MSDLSGLVLTIPSAEASGLVPHGYTVFSDEKPGEIEISRLRFVCPVKPVDKGYITWPVLLGRVAETGAIGGLGMARFVINAQEEILASPDLDTVEIILPHTVLVDPDGTKLVPILFLADYRWKLTFSVIEREFDEKTRIILLAQ